MNAGAKMLRSLMLVGILAGVVAAEGSARACTNDIDCPGNAACGGDVCDYSTGTPTCKPAGGAAKGQDGWCAAATDCKCMAQGAVCNAPYCSFTTPQASGTAGASGGTAGTAGTAGSGGSTSAGGSGGSSTGTAGTGGAGPTKSSSSGGCSVASSTSGGFAALLGLALVAGGLARRRRRA
jgi:MYXO-CTERM domain-containing protein